MKKTYLIILAICFSGVLLAQNTRSTETPKPPRPQYKVVKKQKKSLFSFLKKKETDPHRSTKAEEVAAFRKRIRQVYKQKAKEEKIAKKPEYSDHSYFGHKRPPKKHPPGKQKFCKVCKLKH